MELFGSANPDPNPDPGPDPNPNPNPNPIAPWQVDSEGEFVGLGSFVYVEYHVDCEGACVPPSAPPPSPPPTPPTCTYDATPAGSGESPNATSTFFDPNMPMPSPSAPPSPLYPADMPGMPPSPSAPACDLEANATDASGEYSCGDRIERLKSDMGMTDADAREQVAREFPTICGFCSSPSPPPPPWDMRQCYVTVSVKDTDYNARDKYVVGTTVNGVQIHGKCTPYVLPDPRLLAAAQLAGMTIEDSIGNSTDGELEPGRVDERGFFECVRMVPIPMSPDGAYTFVTSATPEVNGEKYEGSYVYVEYMVDCDGECSPPAAPPMPTCAYSATPVGGGNSTNVTSTFTDPHAPMPLPPPAPPAPPVPLSPPLAPAPPGGYSPPPPALPPPPPAAPPLPLSPPPLPPPSPSPGLPSPSPPPTPPPAPPAQPPPPLAPAPPGGYSPPPPSAPPSPPPSPGRPPASPPLPPDPNRQCYLTVQVHREHNPNPNHKPKPNPSPNSPHPESRPTPNPDRNPPCR